MAQTIIESRGKQSGFMRRISWAAIFGGVVVVLITQLMLSLLGLAFGAGSVDPLIDKNPFSGLGLGSAIWFGVTTIVALFAGGWVAARLGALPDRTDSALHGVLTWGLSTFLLAYLVTSTVGGILSGAAGIVGKTANLVGQGAKLIAPELAQAVGAEFGDQGITWNEVKKEAQSLLRQTKKPALPPKALNKMAEGIHLDTQASAGAMADAPQTAPDELSKLWGKIEARGETLLDAADQEAIANILVARTDMTKQQAVETVARWQKTLADGRAKLANMKANVEQNLRKTADTTAEAVSKAAAWSFTGLFLGLIAAIGGGLLGSPVKGNPIIFRRRALVSEESAA